MEQIWEEGHISPESLLGIVLFLLIINFLIILQDYQSFLRHLLHSFLCFLTTNGKAGCATRTTSQCCNTRPYKVANVASHMSNFNVSTVSPPVQKTNISMGLDISMKEVGIVMDKLGIFHNHPDEEASTARVRSEEIIGMFEFNEPSFNEIKEAFDVFDENTDGYIDANELSKIINALGYGKFSELECKWLIRSFDENGDGLIDFKEFTKLVEKSFS